MKDKIINDLNALFKARAEFYAFFDTHIPKVGQTAVFDFAKLRSASSINGANSAHKQTDTNLAGENLNSNTNSNQSPNLEQIYKLFYNYDYGIRKLLPNLYKAYDIDIEKDLSKDF